jgi:hypothetical protein
VKIGKARNVPKNRCLNCDKLLDGASAIYDEKRDPRPRAGDITVCSYCQHIMLFDADLKFRNPTFSEIADLANDVRILKIKPVLKQVFK